MNVVVQIRTLALLLSGCDKTVLDAIRGECKQFVRLHLEHMLSSLEGSLAGIRYGVRDGQSWKDLVGHLVPYFRGGS